MRRAVGALQRDLDVSVVEDAGIAGEHPDGARGLRPDRRRSAASPARPGTMARPTARARTAASRYRTFPVIAKCARRFRAQQASLDSWQSGISLP